MPKIFRGVKYHIPAAFPEPRRTELALLLKKHHAKRAATVFDATHIITNCEDFKGCEEIDVENVSVVTGLWVEHSIAAKKIQSVQCYSASPSKLFSGVIACSIDLSPGDEDVLAFVIPALGGRWRVNPGKIATHLFAIWNPHLSKRYEVPINSGKGHAKVLRPNWFDDSLSLGFRDLSTDAYEWRTLKIGPELQFQPQILQLLEYPSDVWGGRRILLGTGLRLTKSRRLIVEDGIRRCGGTVVEYTANGGTGDLYEELAVMNRCDVFITCHRSGTAFFEAWEDEVTIGTLHWLLEMQATGIPSGPLDRLLNFPYPPGKVKGIKETMICLSHYSSESAEYLKTLIKLMGGVSTSNLEAKITVVVAAHPRSKLTAKAVEASIPIVNHTWLEDCFIEWELLDTTLPKYTLFPADVEFGALGERGIGHEIERLVAAQQKGYFGYH
ncbi:hypothetical protein C8R46DRAFT_1301947 [Mycena filopes]|nr:hypothetical protein C8R46DRAFT_1301947 [Mycena filopes]